MEMQFKNEIKKLADVVVWADNWIKELEAGLTEEEFTEDEEVKAFEAVKKAVLDAMTRHTTYTNALNKDISDKSAKIERLEKEIEGRKEGYTALKELMDTKYISIDEHNKEIEEITKSRDIWLETAGTHSATILHNSEEINKLKEEIKKLNKCIMEKDKTIKTAYGVMTNLQKEIGAHEEVNARLSKKITELKKNEELEEKIKNLVQEIDYYKNQERIRTDQLRATESKVEELWKEIEKFTKGDDKDHGRAGFETYIKYIISEEEGKFKAELDKRLSEEVSKISQKRTEEELAKVKGKGGIPCGEDSIE